MTPNPEKRSIVGWLKTEVTRVRVAERSLVLRRAHGALLAVLIAVAVVLIFAVGIFVGFHYPYKVKPRPPLPAGQIAPAPSAPECGGARHALGGCLPQPTIVNQAFITSTRQGPDLSNNDPVSCAQMAAIAAHNAFVVLKVNQGTYYRDRTAATMAACARAHGLVAGGYDFLDFCASSPQAEARFFAALLAADHLLGPRTLPPTGDAEWPTGSLSCNGRSWILAWIYEVHRLTGRWPIIYSGAWWWQPHIGCYWPGYSLAWISGYGVRYPYMPCGRSHLDIWQFTDHGWNGASTSDLSIWRDSAAVFTALTGARRPAPSCGIFPTVRFALADTVKASECNTTRTWDRAKCRNPVRRPVCKSSRYHLLLLRDRVWFVAHHRVTRGHWTPLSTPRWGDAHLGARLQQISRRLNAT